MVTRDTTWRIGRREERWRVFCFAVRAHRALFLCAAVALGAVLIIGRYTSPGGFWVWVQSIGAVLASTLAFLIWWGERAEEWRWSLPRRLTAHYVHEGREVMLCEGAYLAGEADIRAWAQQLGMQMAGEQLAMYPKMEQFGPEVRWDESERALFSHYEITVHLRALPSSLEGLVGATEVSGPTVNWRRPAFHDERFPAGAPKKAAPMPRGAP